MRKIKCLERTKNPMTVIQDIIIYLISASAIISIITKYIITKITEMQKREDAIQLGVQALLRDRLYQMYYHYKEKGYAPIYAKENFRNMYKQYHGLGQNGVMDGYLEKFMDIPDKLESEE